MAIGRGGVEPASKAGLVIFIQIFDIIFWNGIDCARDPFEKYYK